jgi:hypothetical protein
MLSRRQRLEGKPDGDAAHVCSRTGAVSQRLACVGWIGGPLTQFFWLVVCCDQVIGLWVLFSLPVWSAAYKKVGGDTPDWFGVSQVTQDAPGIGAFPRYAPAYDGPSFCETPSSLCPPPPQHVRATSK